MSNEPVTGWTDLRLEQLGFQPVENDPYAHIREYQAFHGLLVDGVAGSITVRHMALDRFCGMPDRMEVKDAQGRCKWGHKEITWTVTGYLEPRLTKNKVIEAYEEAWSYWSDICDIHPTYTSNRSQANVLMGSGVIDRPGGTLAWSELPCGNKRQLQQKYDTRESWVIAERPPRSSIDLVRVAAHEIGHVIGIGHIASGNLLAPTYNPNVRRPQKGDIQEAVVRYGVNRPTPPEPEPEPPRPEPKELVVAFKNARLVA